PVLPGEPAQPRAEGEQVLPGNAADAVPGQVQRGRDPRRALLKGEPEMMGLDFETACDVDLRKHGLDRYVSHDSFRVLLASTHDEDGNTKRIDFLHDSSPLRELRQTLQET